MIRPMNGNMAASSRRLGAGWAIIVLLQVLLCTCCCGEENGFSKELYTNVIQEGDPAGTRVADVQYSGSGTVHLVGVGSGDYELQVNGTIVTRETVQSDQAGDIELTVVATEVVGQKVLVTTAYVLVRVKATENVCLRQVFGRCSQICVENPATELGYACDCAEGYSLQRNGYICQANDPEPIVILSSTSGIFSFNTRTRAFGSVASTNSTVSAMAYDTPNRVLFVAYGNRIASVSKDGAALRTLYSDAALPTDDIQGLDWDWSSGRLYFSSASQGTVFALPLDTSEPTPQVLVSGRVSPRGVTLNVVTRDIFWIEGPASSSSIITAKLASGGGVALSSSPTPIVSNLNGTMGLAVDSVLQRVWWTRASGLVESAGFDGSQREILHNGSIPLTSIDVFEDFVYTWVPSIGELLKVNKFARHEVFFEDEPLYTSFPSDLQEALILVVHPLRQPNASQDVDECSQGNGGCEQRCVNFIGSFSCTCYHGYSVNSDGRSCDLAGVCATGSLGCTHSCEGESCICRQGFQLADDNTTCVDVNECAAGTDGCSHYCINEEGGYRCTCPTRLFLATDGLTCEGCSVGNGGCSHVCTVTPLGHTCHCRSGFRLGRDGRTCYVEEVSELIFSARRQEESALGHTVFTADMSGRAFSRLVDVNLDEDPMTGPVYGMEYDLQTNVLVYADRADKSLWRVPLQRIISATDLRKKIAANVTAWGLAFNHLTRELYWTDDSAGMICRSSLDSFTGCEPVVTGLDQPRGIALDLLGTLYWSEAGTNTTRIASTVPGGVGDVATIVSGPAHLTEPGGIAIDYVTQLIYWADSGGGAIGVAGLDGSNPRSLVSALPTSPFQVAVDGDVVFWSNLGSINYNFADRMDPRKVYSSQLLEPLARSFTLFGLVIVHRRPDQGFQLCLNETAGCSHYCNGVGSNFSCSCPPGFTLAEDGRRCVQPACEVDNGGCNQTCVTSNTSSDAYCDCEEGDVLDSDGRQCIGICSTVSCPDNAVCLPQSGGPPLCVCPPGSTTPNCTIVDPCASYPCQSGANCTVVGVVDFECVCPAGTTGENCTRDCPMGTFGVGCIGMCACGNGAVCSPMDGSCTCPAGFTGPRCQNVCPNGTYGTGCNMTCDPCVNGDCDPVTGECVCDSGYSGDPCAPICNPMCENGGTCIAPGQCSCGLGFTGTLCNLCPDAFCFSRGTCNVINERRVCLCDDGFIGARCENENLIFDNQVQALDDGATAGVTIGVLITVGVVGAAIVVLVGILVARQRRRRSQATAHTENKSFENDTYGWAESKDSEGVVEENMAAMKSDELEAGYVIASSPPSSLQHTGGQASNRHSDSGEPQSGDDAIQNGEATSFANYDTLRHVSQ